MDDQLAWKSAVISQNSSVYDAIQSLELSGLKIVVVVTNEQIPIGILSDGDLRRAILSDMQITDLVTKYMNPSPMVIPSNLGNSAVQEIMSANKISQLPIIDTSGRLVGIRTLDEVSGATFRRKTMIIMAGGKGTRLAQYTKKIPKPLVEVDGKPLIRHIIDKAKDQGFYKFIISINHMGDLVEQYLGDGSRDDIEIAYVLEDKPLGTAGSLSLIDIEIGENVLVTNCDILGNFCYVDMLIHHENNQADATVAIRKHQVQNEFGVVSLDGIDIKGFIEKPVYVSNINAGLYVFNTEIFDLLEYNEFCDMPTLLEKAIKKSQKVIAFPLHEEWLDVGRPIDLIKAQEMCKENELG